MLMHEYFAFWLVSLAVLVLCHYVELLASPESQDSPESPKSPESANLLDSPEPLESPASTESQDDRYDEDGENRNKDGEDCQD